MSQEPDSGPLDAAIESLLDAGHEKAVESILSNSLDSPASHPAVGSWWMRRRIAHEEVSCPRQVEKRCPASEVACRAVITLIGALSKRGRLWSLRALAYRNRRWLKTHDYAWAAMGTAYLDLRQYRLAAHWFRHWHRRPRLKMWMLYNVVIAMRAHTNHKQAESVIRLAMTLPDRDQTFHYFRLLFALEEALAGRTDVAAGHLRELDETGWDQYMLQRYHYLRGMVAVQLAAPGERRRVFREERARIRGILDQQSLSPRDRMNSKDHQRCMIRMAKDARQWWTIIPILCGQ